MNNLPPQLPNVQGRTPSEASLQVMKQFAEMEAHQLEFLDEACKSMIERVSTFLTVLFGLTVLGNTFPPPYLKDNVLNKWLVTGTLLFYLCALTTGLLAIRPRKYRYSQINVTENERILERIRTYKLRCLRICSTTFWIGSILLVALIVVLIWKAS